jgi:APA family basic amino acid/polyamine antiporter
MTQLTNQPAPLSLWRLTLLVAGNIIGSGIFLLPASVAVYGSVGIMAWVVTALGAITLALVFAELSAVLPREGGFYTYCREAFGDFVGFQVAYSYWIALWVGNAALVVTLTGYLACFFPILHDHAFLAWFVNISIIWGLTLLNSFYLRSMILLQTVTTLLKLLPLVGIMFVGLYHINLQHFKVWNLAEISNFTAFNQAATLTLWSFIGLETASLSSHYTANPQRDIPRATILGVLIAALLYIGGYIAIVGLFPFSQLMQSSAPYADVLHPLLGSHASQAVAVLAILSCLGSLAGWVLLQGQVPLSAARDRLFPPVFLKLNKQNVPVAGLMISSVLITILLLLKVHQNFVSQFTFIILLATLASLIPYFFTSLAGCILLLKYSEHFQKKYSWITLFLASIFGSLYAFWAIMGSGESIVFYGCFLLLSSMPIYVGLQWKFHQDDRKLKNIL